MATRIGQCAVHLETYDIDEVGMCESCQSEQSELEPTDEAYVKHFKDRGEDA